MEALILVAMSDGPTMFARIGIMRGLNRGKPAQRRKLVGATARFFGYWPSIPQAATVNATVRPTKAKNPTNANATHILSNITIPVL
jgi:hypothetical protein